MDEDNYNTKNRCFFTIPDDKTFNMTDSFQLEDLTVIGSPGKYNLRFIDCETCQLSENSIEISLTYDDGGVIMYIIIIYYYFIYINIIYIELLLVTLLLP